MRRAANPVAPVAALEVNVSELVASMALPYTEKAARSRWAPQTG